MGVIFNDIQHINNRNTVIFLIYLNPIVVEIILFPQGSDSRNFPLNLDTSLIDKMNAGEMESTASKNKRV